MRTVLVRTVLLVLLCAAAVVCAATLARAAAPAPPRVRAVRTTGPIVVDGVLDEPVWRADNAITYLPQADPHQGEPSAERVEIRVAYDDDAIYVGARLFDQHPDSIVARVTRRDTQGGSDLFAVAFDTFHDRRTGYYFGVTASGTQMDGTLMNDDWDDDRWDGVWNSRVRRGADGWTVEMRVPFSQMRRGGGEHPVWGVNFQRFITRLNQDQKLTFTPTGQSGFVSRFAELTGLEGLRTRHVYELTPYTTGRAEYLAHSPGDPFHAGGRYRPALGADLRTNVGSRLTLNATANPDFGQVEIDPAQVNLSDVETFYGEKRPFFTEGTSVFSCGNNGASDYWNFNWPEPVFFYPRRIGRAPEGALPEGVKYADAPVATHILGALKLTGQPADRFSFGTLHAVTEKEVADFQRDDGTRGSAAIEPATYYGVLRGLKSFRDERQGLGAMVLETRRFFDGTRMEDALNHNAVVTAVDGWTFLDAKKTWVVSGYATASRIDGTPARIAALEQGSGHYYQRPDRGDLGVDANATSLAGAGARLWLNKQTGPWMSNSAIGFLTPGFEANDMGFTYRSDIVNAHIGGGYNWNKPNAWKKYFWVLGAVSQSWNFAGQHTQDMVFAKSSLEQINGWSWQASGGWFARAVSDRATRGGPALASPAGGTGELYWDSNSKAKLFWSFDVSLSGDAAGGHELVVSPGVTWKPSSNLSFTAGPMFDDNHENAHFLRSVANPASPTYGRDYVFATLQQATAGAQVRLDCSLTSDLSVQVFVQPLVSSGRYWNHRALARGGSYEFRSIGPDATGDDFTYRTVRGNAVVRWQYIPGSALYLIWTQDRTAFENDGRFRFGPSLGALSTTPVNNIFMVKATRHFDL